jgi:multidrug efflux pump subunit AcrA (membrane-fusion protein)
MGVRVNFLERAATSNAAPKGVLIPAAALIDVAAGQAAWRVRDGRVERVPVRVLASLGDLRRVTGALLAGEQVVIKPSAHLRAGMAVRVAATRGD